MSCTLDMKRINITGIVLLTAGITIGIALTMISMHVVGRDAKHTAAAGGHQLVAEKSPPGAADAQTAQPEAPAQPTLSEPAAEQEVQAEPKAPADWLKPQDLAAQNGATAPAAPQYRSSHTEYYIYPHGQGQGGPVSYPTNMATPESGVLQPSSPVMIGENGLIQNPCVDPPSCRGRAYRYAPQ